MAQVTVYHQYSLFLDGKAHGDVHGKERLAATGVERGDDKHILPTVLAKHKVYIRAEYTERLVDDITTTFFHHNGPHIGLYFIIES